MSDITVINDSEQSSLVTNGLAKNGELYLKAAGSTDAGAIVVYDSGSWRTFANEAASFSNTYSVDFDGTNDYMSLGNISSLSSASAFTLSTWVKTSTNNKYIYSSYASGLTDSIQMYFHSGGTLRCIIGSGSSWYQIGTSSTTLADGTWKNFTFVFSGGNYVKIYVNGSEETTSFVNGTNTVPTNTVANAGNTPRIADYVTGGFSLNGLIDEVALFNSALSASDITSIYNSGVPTDLASYSPVGWWRMGDNDGGTGTTITDQGSGGNDGTLTNGPTFSTTVPS